VRTYWGIVLSVIDPELRQRARRRQNQRMVLALALALVSIIVIEGLGLWRGSLPRTHSDHPNWPLRLAILAFPLALVAVTFGLLLLLRRRGVAWLQPPPAMGLDRRHRRRLLRAVRKGDHLAGPEGEIAIDLARRIVNTRWIYLLLPILFAVEAAQILSGGVGPLLGWFTLACFALAVIALAAGWRDVRRARLYLWTRSEGEHRPRQG
jgi:hypothetical protein